MALAVLAASMSTGDALLHAGASILVRDVLLATEHRPAGRSLIRGLRAAKILPPPATPGAALRSDDAGPTRAIR